LYSRGKLKTSEPVVHNAQTRPEGSAAGSAIAAATPTMPDPESAAAESTASTANMDDYRVRLADEEAAKRQLNEQELGKNAEVANARGLGAGSGSASNFAFQPTPPPSTSATAKLDADKGARPGYITLEKKDEPAVLALDGQRYERGAAPTDTTITRDGLAQGSFAESPAKQNAPAPGADAPAPPPPPPSSIATQQTPATGSTAGASRTTAQKPVARVARDQGKAGAKAYDATKAAALDAWARDQHARMVKLVNAGKCLEAGPIGAEIARRAPEYYQTNVYNDRAVRACRPYVDRARRAKSEDAKSKAAAPKASAPDAYDADVESAH
jgi:hypothetical protein